MSSHGHDRTLNCSSTHLVTTGVSDGLTCTVAWLASSFSGADGVTSDVDCVTSASNEVSLWCDADEDSVTSDVDCVTPAVTEASL